MRDDGFFDSVGAVPSDGEQVLEGVLRQAAATYDVRKLPYLAHLYDSVVQASMWTLRSCSSSLPALSRTGS